MMHRKLFIMLTAIVAFGSMLATPQQDLEQSVRDGKIQMVNQIIQVYRSHIARSDWDLFIYPSLCLAVREGYPKIFELLITSCINGPLCLIEKEGELLDIICQDVHAWIVPLMLKKRPKIVRWLVDVAIRKRFYEHFLFLVRRDVPIEYESDLDTAVHVGNVPVLRYLLNKKPELINRVNRNNRNLLHAAVEYGGGLPVLRCLFEVCRRPCLRLLNQQTTRGLTPLHYAAARQKNDAENIVKYLLQQGARTDIKTHRGILAWEKATKQVVRDLLRPPLNAPANQSQPVVGPSEASQQGPGSGLGGLAALAEVADTQEQQGLQRERQIPQAGVGHSVPASARLGHALGEAEQRVGLPAAPPARIFLPDIDLTSSDFDDVDLSGLGAPIDLTGSSIDPFGHKQELRLPELQLESMLEPNAQANNGSQSREKLGQTSSDSGRRDVGGVSQRAQKSRASASEHVARRLGNELIEAAKTGDFDTAQRVLNEGANINHRTALRSTPLIETASNDHLRCVRLLLDQGADVNAKDFYSRTALEKALEKGYLEIARLLIDRGADVNREPDVESPLYIAAQKNNLEAMQLLIRSGAKIDVDFGEYSPFNAAIESGNQRMVKYMVEAGVSLDGKSQRNPVLVAARREEIENDTYLNIAKYLISKEPELAHQSFGGYHTPLHLAATRGLTQWVSYLCRCEGVKIDCKGLNGETPLHTAARYGHLETVKRLLEAGANTAVKTRRGETAQLLARQNGYHVIVTLLTGYAERSQSAQQPTESVGSPEDVQGVDPDQKLLTDGGLRRSMRLQARTKRNYCELLDDDETETDDTVQQHESQRSKRKATTSRSQKSKMRAKKPKKHAKPANRGSINLLLQAVSQAGQRRDAMQNTGKHVDVSHSASQECASRSNEEKNIHALLQAAADLAQHVVQAAHGKRRAANSHSTRPPKKAKSAAESNQELACAEYGEEVNTQNLLPATLKDDIILAFKAGDRQKIDQCLAQYPNLLSRKDGKMGCGLLHMLAHDGDELAFFSLVLQFAGDEQEKVLSDALNGLTTQGATVLHYAAMGGNVNIVEYLIGKGLRISSTTEKGVTPFMCAVENRHTALVCEMLKKMNDAGKRAIVNQPSYEGQLPLIMAAQKGCPEIVGLLISNGAAVDAYDVNGQTALAAAVLKGHADVIEILRNNGARLDQHIANNETVEVIARRRQENDRILMSLLGSQ